jgi:hypothetical protein
MVDRNGVRSEACITCFEEEEWGVLKEALGTGRVSGRRAFEPHIVMGPDSSHQLQSTMLRIIIEVRQLALPHHCPRIHSNADRRKWAGLV